jgi:hypothetical protein
MLHGGAAFGEYRYTDAAVIAVPAIVRAEDILRAKVSSTGHVDPVVTAMTP